MFQSASGTMLRVNPPGDHPDGFPVDFVTRVNAAGITDFRRNRQAAAVRTMRRETACAGRKPTFSAGSPDVEKITFF
jgi:hypothetical protein